MLHRVDGFNYLNVLPEMKKEQMQSCSLAFLDDKAGIPNNRLRLSDPNSQT